MVELDEDCVEGRMRNLLQLAWPIYSYLIFLNTAHKVFSSDGDMQLNSTKALRSLMKVYYI